MNIQTTMSREDGMEGQEKRKIAKKWKIIGIVALVLVLALAAFVGGMWLVGRATGMNAMMDPAAFEATLIGLEQTPDEPPEMAGGVRRVEDNSIFVSTMNSTGAFVHGPGASLSEGPTVEVVVERDTVILADVTAMDFDFGDFRMGGRDGMAIPQGEGMEAFDESTRRVIEEGVLEDIEPNTMIWIWGERTGDRIVATAVLYMVLPFSM